MLDNLMVIGIIISIAWMGLIAAYLYISREQKGIREDIEALEAILGDE